jgi:hypothetical protein
MIDAARMLKRRLASAGIVGAYSPHSFRATGLTRFLEEGGYRWRRPSTWPITPTAGPPSYTTAAARKYSAKLLSGFDININCDLGITSLPSCRLEAPPWL